MALFQKGQIGCNKGKTFSDEWRKNLSLAHLGKKQSPETIVKRALALKGHNVCAEARKKISEGLKNNKNSLGFVRSDEWKKNLSLRKKGNTNCLGQTRSVGTRQKMSLARMGIEFTEAQKRKLGDASRARWQIKEYREKMLSYIPAGRIKRPTSIELKMQAVLNEHFPKEWEYVGDGQCWIAGKCPDFLNVNGHKALIEIFGAYWHKPEDEQCRISHFAKYGFKTLVVWDTELKNEAKTVARIKDIIK